LLFASGQSAQLPARPPSRHEAILWRQVGQILFALDALDRRKPQERGGVSVSVAGKTCRLTDTTIELTEPQIYAMRSWAHAGER